MSQLFILTGAGISAESGLKTFRDSDGLWEGHRVEDVATRDAYARNPRMVHDFYNMRRSQLQTVEPNAAHRALGRLEKEWPGQLTLVTQNVDDLHERGGCSDVWHMHGELLKKRCELCNTVSACREDLSVFSECSQCGHAGGLRPHIVWFGEIPLLMDEIYERVSKADLFVSIGTSGVVYPAAGLAAEAKSQGARTVELNMTDTEVSPCFDELIHGPATESVPAWVDALLSEGL
ncbi:NAD-dependent deacylase [Verrucomicrobiaceae bacterium N1E253]|uniref:NAD-dependent protein deacylase n=1 Tax=Oceaniferula marina TaxID=2748318 RepID=A0A851GI88_9BACT|nr:NAD-dependent deacylase [Oceaniferula marina]NWK56909.1 NAD-dependent deacylase [Oceaniferula marina]